jgi:hypothetical protein
MKTAENTKSSIRNLTNQNQIAKHSTAIIPTCGINRNKDAQHRTAPFF